MAPASHQLLTTLLRDVSRSFYLTLRVLPASVRPQIGLAYLLARATDTIADTGLVSVDQRLRALDDLRARILGSRRTPLALGEFAGRQGSPSERILLERVEEAIGLLETLSPPDRQRVREALSTITSGQELDLRRFAGASAGKIAALQTDEELDDYTYRVAGCVGEFWTRMCRAHLFPAEPLDDAALLANGVRFGKGLQLVNILRDLPADLAQGRCYLPAQPLQAAGLAPADLANPANEPRLRPLYNLWLGRAEAHLQAGWVYTNTLPWRCIRVRLACSWPILIGLQTLALLRTNNVLEPHRRLKITRGQLRMNLVRSVLYYPFPPLWKALARSEV